MVVALLAVYCVIGLAVVRVGPVRRSIDRQVDNLRGNELANSIAYELTGRKAPSEGRLLAFRLVMCFVAALLWPWPLVSVLREEAREAKELKEWQKEGEQRRTAGLDFGQMAGGGEISCGDCGFREDIVSFTHGRTVDGEECCDEGRQCLSCGKFATVHVEGVKFVVFYDLDEHARVSSTTCQCGGQLSRDQVLVCPRCRSKNLQYSMGYIT
jgi:hypothetical protein